MVIWLVSTGLLFIVNTLYFHSYFNEYLEFDDDLNWCHVWISYGGIVVDFDIELYFFLGGLCHVFRQNSVRFLVDVRVLEYFEYHVVI